jgi:hypothetical protein
MPTLTAACAESTGDSWTLPKIGDEDEGEIKLGEADPLVRSMCLGLRWLFYGQRQLFLSTGDN